MARPQSLRALAEHLGLNAISQICCSCFYCGTFLTHADKVLFDNANLNLIWSDSTYYASCFSCVKTTARLDFMANFEGVHTAEEIQQMVEGPLTDWDFRCVSCLRRLNHSEKCDVVCSDSDVFVIRGSFRTQCVVCRIGL